MKFLLWQCQMSCKRGFTKEDSLLAILISLEKHSRTPKVSLLAHSQQHQLPLFYSFCRHRRHHRHHRSGCHCHSRFPLVVTYFYFSRLRSREHPSSHFWPRQNALLSRPFEENKFLRTQRVRHPRRKQATDNLIKLQMEMECSSPRGLHVPFTCKFKLKLLWLLAPRIQHLIICYSDCQKYVKCGFHLGVTIAQGKCCSGRGFIIT